MRMARQSLACSMDQEKKGVWNSVGEKRMAIKGWRIGLEREHVGGEYCRKAKRVQFIVHSPWLGGDKVNSGIELSYRPARLHRLAGRYDNPTPESTISPSQGLWIWLLDEMKGKDCVHTAQVNAWHFFSSPYINFTARCIKEVVFKTRYSYLKAI